MAAASATGTIVLSGAPEDGDYITIPARTGYTATVFEFDVGDAITGGRVGVVIGSDEVDTADNLAAAINDEEIGITAVHTLGDGTLNLTAVAGAGQNVVISNTESGSVIATTGLTGGMDAMDSRDMAGCGTGLPISLTFTDPGSASYTAAQTLPRHCSVLRAGITNSGMVISLDGGTTDHITVGASQIPQDIPVMMPLGTTIAVRRLAAGTPMTGIIFEAR